MLETGVFIFLCGHLSNLSLTAGGIENCHFLALESVPPRFDIVIPKTPLYESMVVWILE